MFNYDNSNLQILYAWQMLILCSICITLKAPSFVYKIKCKIGICMKDFKKYYTINTTPEVLYAALTQAHTIQLWSGSPAIMSEEVGSEFSLWDDSIEGKNLEFEKDKKIVQQWYFGEQDEPSIVTFKIFADKNKTSVEIRHTNIPDDAYDDIVAGWNEVYIGSLVEFYEEG